MRLRDLDDDMIYTLEDLHSDWQVFRKEDPENHAESFQIELHEILMATINGRNNMEVIGMTPREVSNYIMELRHRL